VTVVPFAICVTVALMASYNVKRLPWISTAGALLLLALALPDFSRSVGIAMIEVAIGAAALVASIGSFSGTYRLASDR
jgi:hypothetical protein